METKEKRKTQRRLTRMTRNCEPQRRMQMEKMADSREKKKEILLNEQRIYLITTTLLQS